MLNFPTAFLDNDNVHRAWRIQSCIRGSVNVTDISDSLERIHESAAKRDAKRDASGA